MSTTRNISRSRGLALSALLLCAASAAQAVPLFYSGTSVVPFGYPTSPYFGGAGTVLTAAITFEVSPGTPSTATLLSATGTVTWNDGVDRVFTVSDVSSSSFLSIKGWYPLAFHGTGPSIGWSRFRTAPQGSPRPVRRGTRTVRRFDCRTHLPRDHNDIPSKGAVSPPPDSATARVSWPAPRRAAQIPRVPGFQFARLPPAPRTRGDRPDFR